MSYHFIKSHILSYSYTKSHNLLLQSHPLTKRHIHLLRVVFIKGQIKTTILIVLKFSLHNLQQKPMVLFLRFPRHSSTAIRLNCQKVFSHLWTYDKIKRSVLKFRPIIIIIIIIGSSLNVQRPLFWIEVQVILVDG